MNRVKGAFVAIALLHGATASALTIEAERAKVRTIGGPTEGGWNLWSNGHLGDHIRVARQAAYAVVVRARGSPAAGVWPNMSLVVDGKALGSATVSSATWAEYPFRVDLAPGLHAVAVAFTNDAVAGNEDRNLYLDRIDILPPAGAPDPQPASAEELAMKSQQAEDATLEQARAAIETNRKGDAIVKVVDADGKPVAGAKVVVDHQRHDFLFGCNIFMFDRFGTAEENELYQRRFRELFNAATVGFYWRWYEPERGKPIYPYTDKVVAWCREHDIAVKGHPLLWACEHGIPKWAGNQQPPPAVRKQRVTEILQRYRGTIRFWEVVNEPAHLGGLKIDAPYRWAREADPDAYLIVNDYYVMADGYPPFFALLQKAMRDGVPFDGIGIQAHEPRTMRFPLEQVQRVLDHYATLGKELHITEFTPTTGGQPITGSHVEGTWTEATQADYAAKFYTVCFAHPAVAAITWWDLCERGAWLQGGGLLRKDLKPKKVYTDLRELIHETWHTRAEGTTDAKGEFAFRGFHGTYAVEANGQKSTIHLGKGEKGEITVRLR